MTMKMMMKRVVKRKKGQEKGRGSWRWERLQEVMMHAYCVKDFQYRNPMHRYSFRDILFIFHFIILNYSFYLVYSLHCLSFSQSHCLPLSVFVSFLLLPYPSLSISLPLSLSLSLSLIFNKSLPLHAYLFWIKIVLMWFDPKASSGWHHGLGKWCSG